MLEVQRGSHGRGMEKVNAGGCRERCPVPGLWRGSGRAGGACRVPGPALGLGLPRGCSGAGGCMGWAAGLGILPLDAAEGPSGAGAGRGWLQDPLTFADGGPAVSARFKSSGQSVRRSC